MAKLPRPIKSKDPVVILKHVIALIKAEPKRYDQSTYMETPKMHCARGTEHFPACGTICCVAGWVNIVAGKSDRTYGHQEGLAKGALGLTESEAYELFDGSPPAVRSRAESTPRQHAADGIKHIKRFVLKKWGKKI